LARLLYLYGQYKKLLRGMWDAYDPENVNKRMQAVNEQANIAAETKIKRSP